MALNNAGAPRRMGGRIRRLWSNYTGAAPVDEMERLRQELKSRGETLAARDKAIEFLRGQVARLEESVASRDEGIRFLRLQLAKSAREPQEQREWWDAQFAEAWEKNSGPAQSRHFMQRLIENLPPAERRFLGSRRLRILDWGCATGDGVIEWAKAFPVCDAVGVDLSGVAIEKARRKYPGLTFLHTGRGAFEDRFDVIVTSNCLEHFDAPLEWLERLLQQSRWLVIVLVPYREENLIEGHKVSFSEDSFPEVFRGFTRLHAGPISVDRTFWDGLQLLVIYGSPSYVREAPGV